MKATRFLIAGVSVTALMHAMPALAQDEDASAVGYGIDIITVTAQKKAESIQDTPISIVAFEGEAMSAEGRNEIRDVLDRVAGLSFKNAAYGATSINLRGIEGINGAQGKTDPAVPLYFDGVVQPALLGDPGTTTFFDIDRVEVLRGPQGTLYGRGASAGLVNVITNNPVDEYEAGMAIEVGNYDMTRATGYANIPLAEGVAFRASAQHLRRDSFYTSGANNARQTAARAKLQYEPSDTIRVLVGGEYAKVGGNLGAGGRGAGITAWGLGDPAGDPWDDITTDGGLTGQVPGSTQDDDFYKVWGEVDVDLPFANLTVIPGYSEVDRNRVLVRKLGSSPPGVYNSVDNTIDGNQTSIEARLSSLPESPVEWLLGFYYDDTDSSYFLGEFNRLINQTQSSTAGFGSITVPVTDAFRVTGGVRYTSDDKSFVTERPAGSYAASGDRTWNRWDWRTSAELDLAQGSMIYATVATGYRPGAVDTGTSELLVDLMGNTFPNTSLFSEPEKLRSYEIGTKNVLFGDTLVLNADVFYMDYKNRQYSYFTTTADPLSPCPNGSAPQFFGPDVVCNQLANAAKVKIFGAELESTWAPTDYDKLDLSVAYTNSEGNADEDVSLSIPPGSTIPAGANVVGSNIIYNTNGATMPQAPKWQVKAQYRHAFDIGYGRLSAGGGVRYSSESYISGFNYLNDSINTAGIRVGDLYIIDSNTQFDAFADFRPHNGIWSVSFYIRNITEEIVKSATDGSTTQVEPPRTFGFVIKADF